MCIIINRIISISFSGIKCLYNCVLLNFNSCELSESAATTERNGFPDYVSYNRVLFTAFCCQLYELGTEPERKEFLDDLFSFMQKRGELFCKILVIIYHFYGINSRTAKDIRQQLFGMTEKR